ncbi:MAG TPA: hypothetical protein DIW23_07535 [Anaerolineae bacterium]|nr:hypothetical protein [Anaerolineae bacterium]
MSSQIKAFFILVFLGFIAFGAYQWGKSTLVNYEEDMSVNACPVVMEDIIASAQGNVYEMGDEEESEEYVEPETYYLVIYSVNGDELTNPQLSEVPTDLEDEQTNSELQKEAWEIFTTLIPPQDRAMVAQYNVFTDGESNTLAAVDQTSSDLTDWIVEVDIADLEDKHAFIFTMVHEYAHLLTLNASQSTVDAEIYADPSNVDLLTSKDAFCPTYFTGGGCSMQNSYIRAFYNRYWVDVAPEWQAIDALQYEDDLTAYYDGLFNFYLKYQDQFVDDYATTHPAEDIAESFTYFVFSPKPQGDTIKEQKILFFYAYPELIELRQFILEGTCSLFE